jgi:predicted HD phosphohydrolase
MVVSIETIVEVLETRGPSRYGSEAVSQLDHALQCAQLAADAGEAKELVVSALLHDLGHMLSVDSGQREAFNSNIQERFDDLHQFHAVAFLRGTFSERILAPIRMHIDAKRYLCAIDYNYWANLTPASKYSLEVQGGILDSVEANQFSARPHALHAVTLRRFDDLAKVPGKKTESIEYFSRLLDECAIKPGLPALELVR